MTETKPYMYIVHLFCVVNVVKFEPLIVVIMPKQRTSGKMIVLIIVKTRRFLSLIKTVYSGKLQHTYAYFLPRTYAYLRVKV